jgi:hypothetical protein
MIKRKRNFLLVKKENISSSSRLGLKKYFEVGHGSASI